MSSIENARPQRIDFQCMCRCGYTYTIELWPKMLCFQGSNFRRTTIARFFREKNRSTLSGFQVVRNKKNGSVMVGCSKFPAHIVKKVRTWARGAA